MLKSTHKYLIVFDKNEKKDQYVNYLINSVKISFNEQNNFESVKDMVKCTKCGAVLHIKDTPFLWSIEDYHRNIALFQEDLRLNQYANMNKNYDKNDQIWVCRFCGKHKKISKKESFMDKPISLKRLLKDTKSNKEPIVLFLIDWSGSMQEQIIGNEENYKLSKEENDKMSQEFETTHKVLLDLLESSKLYKEFKKLEGITIENKTKNHSQYQPSQKKNICKNHLLLALIEKVMKQMKIKEKQSNIKRKYGFIFFNELLFLAGNCTKPGFNVVVSKNIGKIQKEALQFSLNLKDEKRIKYTDYQSYKDLFSLGEESADFYNSPLSTFQDEDAKFNGIISDGQTALGPALALALGIVSKYGEGSTIMAITDGNANKGILSSAHSSDKQKQNLDMISKCLHSYKCKFGILQWTSKQSEEINHLDTLSKNQPSLVLKLQINLKADEKRIDLYCKSIMDLTYERRLDTQIIDLKWNCSVKFIQFVKSDKAQEHKNKADQQLYKQLISSKSTLWMDIKIKQDKIENYYLQKHPIYTQLHTIIRKIDTGQQFQYVSEVEHYLTRNKYKIRGDDVSLDYFNIEQRIARNQVDPNPFFDKPSIVSVNNSINSIYHSKNGGSIDVSFSAENQHKQAVSYHISCKQYYLSHDEDID